MVAGVVAGREEDSLHDGSSGELRNLRDGCGWIESQESYAVSRRAFECALFARRAAHCVYEQARGERRDLRDELGRQRASEYFAASGGESASFVVARWAVDCVCQRSGWESGDLYGEGAAVDCWPPADRSSGVDSLIAKGIVDKDRVASMGWSEGGYISALIT